MSIRGAFAATDPGAVLYKGPSMPSISRNELYINLSMSYIA
jgi:hypothetical protein